MTDFGKITNYAAFVKEDPFRNGLHYPALLNLLQCPNQKILDVGCGDGLFPRMLAKKGATVLGYDLAQEKIAEAKQEELNQPLGIKYLVASSETFSYSELFNQATSVMVLPYAPTSKDLDAFFRSTFIHLADNGKFISVIFNPQFKAFNKIIGSRRFNKLTENKVEVEFLDVDSKQTKFTSLLQQYTEQEYEQSALSSGFELCSFKKLFATAEAIEKFGSFFWEECHQEQPYALFVAQKTSTTSL